MPLRVPIPDTGSDDDEDVERLRSSTITNTTYTGYKFNVTFDKDVSQIDRLDAEALTEFWLWFDKQFWTDELIDVHYRYKAETMRNELKSVGYMGVPF